MNFTEEEIIKIEEYSGLFLNYEEISVLLNKNILECIKALKNRNNKGYEAYLRGKTKTKKELREKIILMAKRGSPNAEVMVNKFIIDQEIFEKNG